MKLLKISLCVIIMLIVVSCSSTDATGNYSKNEMKVFDIASRGTLRNAENAGGKDVLYFTALLTQKPDDAIKAKLEKIGITTISNVGKIITCNALPSQIRQLAGCDFVTKIEIGKTLQIKKTGETK